MIFHHEEHDDHKACSCVVSAFVPTESMTDCVNLSPAYTGCLLQDIGLVSLRVLRGKR